MLRTKKQRIDIPERETLEAARMFEYYYAQGNKRSLKDVSKHFEISFSSVQRYSVAFDWTTQVNIIEKQAIQQLKDELIEGATKIKRRYRLIIQKTIDTFIKRLDQGLVVVTDIVDLEKLIKLDMLLLGEATEKVDNKYEFIITEVKGRVGEVGKDGKIEVKEVKELSSAKEETLQKETETIIEVDGEKIEINLNSIKTDEIEVKKPFSLRKGLDRGN